jgi:hypothetical protein
VYKKNWKLKCEDEVISATATTAVVSSRNNSDGELLYVQLCRNVFIKLNLYI